jgi:nucleotide-binding universal stress UspA family protein
MRWRIEQEKGEVVGSILNRAKTLKTDLIVMTTQGHQGFLDALRGSVTEQILHHAPCPVLAMPASFSH